MHGITAALVIAALGALGLAAAAEPDRSAEIVQPYVDAHERVSMIRHPANRGMGGGMFAVGADKVHGTHERGGVKTRGHHQHVHFVQFAVASAYTRRFYGLYGFIQVLFLLI